jgi:p-cumate 2,3-dioxygenase beta subunit
MTDRASVEDFLYREADLLDAWRLEEWLTLFLPDATFEIPPTDLAGGDPRKNLFIVADDMTVLRGRVQRLLADDAYAEHPHSQTLRIVGYVRLAPADGGDVAATANFNITRSRKGATDTFVGTYRHSLAPQPDGSLRFRRRRAVLAHDALRPHGKVSIIL